VLVVASVAYALLFMSVSATRLVLPAFMLALACVRLEQRQPGLARRLSPPCARWPQLAKVKLIRAAQSPGRARQSPARPRLCPMSIGPRVPESPMSQPQRSEVRGQRTEDGETDTGTLGLWDHWDGGWKAEDRGQRAGAEVGVQCP